VIKAVKRQQIGFLFFDSTKSLNISKGQSESVNQRSADNTMAKRKRTNGTNNNLQNIHIKLKVG
jgi:hypothetical protein